MDVEAWRLVYRVIVIIAFFASVAVVATYHLRSRGSWRTHSLGRHLMSSDAVLATILGFWLAAAFIDSPRVELAVFSILLVIYTFLRIDRVRFMVKSTRIVINKSPIKLFRSDLGMSQTFNTKPRPVVVAMSILAGAQVLAAGSALTDLLGADIAALIVLIIAASQFGIQFYVQNMVTPAQDVVAYRNTQDVIVAGPAASDPQKAAAAVEALQPTDPEDAVDGGEYTARH